SLASASGAENVFVVLSQALLPAVMAGVVMAGILAATISSSDSYLLIAASAVSKNLDRKGVVEGKGRVFGGRGGATLIEISREIGCVFSSRRRHTRSKRDWSSDVCSSDLRWLPPRERKTCLWCCPSPFCRRLWPAWSWRAFWRLPSVLPIPIC